MFEAASRRARTYAHRAGLLAALCCSGLWGCAREALPPQLNPASSAPFSGPQWRSPNLPARIAPPVAPYRWPETKQLWPKIRPPEWAGPEADPWIETVQRAATFYQLPPELLWAVIKVESNFRDQAVSPAGAIGLMQLMPSTATEYGVQHPFDPEENIGAGVAYLRRLMDRYDGRVELALAAYNAGEAAVDRFGGIPPFRETQDYVSRILRLLRRG